MNRVKKIYFMIIFISVFLVSTLCFSYAFFTSKTEGSGKLNIVAGTLNYKMESEDLEDNQITVEANTVKEITINVSSLNDVDSKYELYYLNDSSKVEVGYSTETKDLPSGNISADGTKTIGVVIRNNNSNSQTITFGVEGGLLNNELALTSGKSISEIQIYVENLLNGAEPVLTDNLVPIEIGDDGTVTKANLYNKWYSYEDKKWANAVVLRDNYDESTIYDLSGNGNDATIYGATITDEGLSFDGVDDYAKVDELLLNDTTEFTIEFMALIDASETASIPVELSSNYNVNDKAFMISLNEYKTNGLTFNTHFNDLGYNIKNASNAINNNKYVTYSITFDSTNSYDTFISIYINGVKQDVDVPVDMENIKRDISNRTLGNYPLFIGGRNGTTEFTKMTLKSLRIYTKELSEEEIKNNFNNNVTKDNLLLRYELDGYEENEEIPEDSIESYFVWIPKYSYQLWDLGNYSSLTSISSKEQTINIKFGLTNTDDSVTGECTTPGVAGESGSCAVGEYMTHPAFLAFDTNGFWVGKFETGYDGATTTDEAQVNSSDSSKIIIKPNVYSWRSLTVGNMFKASLNYLTSDNSHMMKNTEWGAVAYLQHSQYGSQTSVRINNNSAYITGYAATVEPTLGYNAGTSIEGNRVESTSLGVDGTYTINYLNTSSVVASTAGNYTGVYDMSGGAWEYVMGYTTKATSTAELSEITSLYSDFFTNSSYEKYYDKYSSTYYAEGYSNRILGDATGEMGPFGTGGQDPDGYERSRASWYRDYGYFTSWDAGWFVRGGYCDSGDTSGSFATLAFSGKNDARYSLRIVLAP